MAKNKKKGVALLSTIILMSVVITVSLLLFTVMASFSLSNKLESARIEKIKTINSIYLDFVDNGQIDGEYGYVIETYSAEANENLKAVVVFNKNYKNVTDLFYYCIYDFSTQQVVASQTKNFDITIKDIDGTNYYYLADLVKFTEV